MEDLVKWAFGVIDQRNSAAADEIRGYIAGLKTKNKRLQEKVETLQGWYDERCEWHDKCAVEKEEINKAYNIVRTDNDQLRKGLESAISRISHWADIAGERGEEADRLRDENERLREELHDAHMLANAISHKGTEDALRGKE